MSRNIQEWEECLLNALHYPNTMNGRYQKVADDLLAKFPELMVLLIRPKGVWMGVPLKTPYGDVFMPVLIKLNTQKKGNTVCAMVNLTRIEQPVFSAIAFKQYFSQPVEALKFIDPAGKIHYIYQIMAKHKFKDNIYLLN